MKNEYGHVTLNNVDGTTDTVFPIMTLGNLALHRTLDENGKTMRGAWTITHIPTGWRIIRPIENVRKARTMLKLFAGAMDWNFSTPESEKIENQRGIFHAVKEVCVRNGLTFVGE